MKVIESSNVENYIIVNVEDDQSTDYLWKWGSHSAIRNGRGDYRITPTNDARMDFQTTLQHLTKIANTEE